MNSSCVTPICPLRLQSREITFFVFVLLSNNIAFTLFSGIESFKNLKDCSQGSEWNVCVSFSSFTLLYLFAFEFFFVYLPKPSLFPFEPFVLSERGSFSVKCVFVLSVSLSIYLFSSFFNSKYRKTKSRMKNLSWKGKEELHTFDRFNVDRTDKGRGKVIFNQFPSFQLQSQRKRIEVGCMRKTRTQIMYKG